MSTAMMMRLATENMRQELTIKPTEPANFRARKRQETKPALFLVHTECTDCSRRGARMRCPDASVLCVSPPLVALSLARFPIRSGQSHQGL